jgi:hypothetical protein
MKHEQTDTAHTMEGFLSVATWWNGTIEAPFPLMADG